MSTNEQLEILRHSTTHVLMHALKRLYGAIPGVGPAIENGFYHDFDCSYQIREEDLAKIEEEMRKIIKEDLTITRQELSIDGVISKLNKDGYIYTRELAGDLKAQGESSVSYYVQGEFGNMCLGPHLESTGKINPEAFKLTKIAGAYWKGDEKNKMIQRVYGVAFDNKQVLDEYLKLQEEAMKRDHRKLGKELDLFHIDEMVGLGLPLWHPKGAMLWRIIEDFWYNSHLKNGYDLVRTPHVGNKILWETSGHWGFYNESMYPPLEVGQTLKESQNKEAVQESEQYLLKPMNCPFHIRIFNNTLHSYKELPFRWAECGTVYRHEKKGQLSGLTRVRGFTQDDAHIICSSDQVENELKEVIDFILYIYKSFGFSIDDINVYLSVRDPESDQYAGTDDGWSLTESVLEKVAKDKKLNISKDVGGAVFYGPKLDFKIKDALGREWQCSTLQFDFNLPERFDMTFINNKGESERPYMLHRALFGSFERFIGLLIEHYAGAFPVWLSPVQVKIVSVGEGHIEFCKQMSGEFKAEGIRVEVDNSNETVGNKIRKATNEKVPYMLVVGDKEMASDKLAVRNRGSRETREISRENFLDEVKKKMANRD